MEDTILMKCFFTTALCILLALTCVSCMTVEESDYEERSWLFSASEADSVDIKLYRSAVEVALWKNDEIFVIAQSDTGFFPDCYISGSTLLCKIDGVNEASRGKLRLFVPESFFAEQWKISTVSGSVSVSQLWGEDCEITTTSGSIRLDKCEVQKLDVTSTSGRIFASDLVCSDEVELSSTSGAVRINGLFPQIDVTTVSGAIEVDSSIPIMRDSCLSSLSGAIRISMPENQGFVFAYSSLSGLVSDDFTAYRGKGNGNIVYKNGAVRIEAETLSGAIALEKSK